MISVTQCMMTHKQSDVVQSMGRIHAFLLDASPLMKTEAPDVLMFQARVTTLCGEAAALLDCAIAKSRADVASATNALMDPISKLPEFTMDTRTAFVDRTVELEEQLLSGVQGVDDAMTLLLETAADFAMPLDEICDTYKAALLNLGGHVCLLPGVIYHLII
jgi:hypothetical protein